MGKIQRFVVIAAALVSCITTVAIDRRASERSVAEQALSARVAMADNAVGNPVSMLLAISEAF